MTEFVTTEDDGGVLSVIVESAIAAAIAEATRPVAAKELVAIAKRIRQEMSWETRGRDAVGDIPDLLRHIAYLDALLRDCQEESSAYQRGVRDGLERGAEVVEVERLEYAVRYLANLIRRQQRCPACRGSGYLNKSANAMFSVMQCGECSGEGWVTAKEGT